MGVFKLFTCGFFFIGYYIDILLIASQVNFLFFLFLFFFVIKIKKIILKAIDTSWWNVLQYSSGWSYINEGHFFKWNIFSSKELKFVKFCTYKKGRKEKEKKKKRKKVLNYFIYFFELTISSISLRTVGSSIVEGISYGCLFTIFLNIFRRTFPDRVFGNLF